MLFDLHTHSTASDGSLSPTELVQRARLAGVDVLAITDHDTVAGIAELDKETLGSLTLLPGLELSTQWGSIGVHIVGLNIQLDSSEFKDALAGQQRARYQRAGIIAEKLKKKGFPDLLPAVIKAAGRATIGRPHFAQQLVAIDAVKTTDEAFRKYLGAGKPGDVKQLWSPLAEVIGWIRNAGGTAVLAHPDKYHLTRTKLLSLISDFKDAGGEAIEVVSGQQTTHKTRDLVTLCTQAKLLASCGSDFHQPEQRWADVGKHSALPDDCTPIWDIW
ncbi:MAG: phosphatase [Gammaproteobacteria bacterium]|nr:MAG: phosphatase [Gammaproteobacteria bacterium]RLA50450.1 MAG: phosphatase [Gammaproteobacteria bacterium]